MRITKLPIPPNPNDSAYKGNQNAYNQAIYTWMNTVRGKIEQSSSLNDTPMNQPFVVTTGYTITSSIAGTSTGTQVANFICTLIEAMIKKGIATSNSPSS